MIKKLITLSLLIINFNISFSQLTEQWVARYNSSDNFNDGSNSIAVDNSGNVYVTGVSFFKAGFEDIVTVKYNSNGIQQWLQRYNSADSSNDIANSIIVDASGNVIVTGESLRRETGKDIITIKYNSSGEKLWSVAYNYNGTVIGKNDDIGIVLRSDEQSNIYVAGTSVSSVNGFDYILLKYNSNGILIFEKRYTGQGNRSDKIHDLKLDHEGNMYVTGESNSITNGLDYLTIKYDVSGNLLWTSRYNGPISFGDIAKSLCIDEEGNVFVTGTSFSTTIDDVLTIKYNSSGVMLWEIRYDGIENLNDVAHSMDIDKSGNIYVAAGSIGKTIFPEFTIIKYNTAGFQEWVRNFIPSTGGSGEATDITVDIYNNIFVAGYLNRGVSQISLNDYVLIKYDTAGNRKAVNLYNGPVSMSDLLSDVQTDINGNVYVTGKSNGAILNYDYATLKYSSLTSINPVSVLIPLSFLLEQNYPNPFNPYTKIKFSIPAWNKGDKIFVTIAIYDILGNVIANLVNENLNPGEYEVEWNGSSFASGTYFYKLSTEGFEDVKKMLLIK